MKRDESETTTNLLAMKTVAMGAWFLSCVAGSACFGIGLWIILDRNYFSAIFGTTLMEVSAYMLMVGGACCMVLFVWGCMGACCNSRVCLYLHFGCLLVATLCIFVGAILAVVYRIQCDQHPEKARQYMRETIQDEYGVMLHRTRNKEVTDSWDETQEKLWCCAVDESGWGLYRQSEWFLLQPGVVDYDKPLVPPSCCLKDQYGYYINIQKCQTWQLGPPSKVTGETNEVLFYRGCYDSIIDHASYHSNHLMGVGFSMSLLQIPALFMSYTLAAKGIPKKRAETGRPPWGPGFFSSTDGESDAEYSNSGYNYEKNRR